jgi:hypothetical protein
MVFTKLFSSITESTIWIESANVRLVWITMLAMADSKGRVWASVPGLANRARVPVEDVEEALSKFLGPDKYSRTPDNEGRRIEKIDGGWRLLNHAKYREIRDTEAIKESKRNYINNRRAKERASTVERGRTQSNPVGVGRANAEAEAEAEKPLQAKPATASATPPPEDLVLKPQSPPEKRLKAPKAEKPADTRHAEFVRIFADEYEVQTGSPYAMQGGKDGQQLQALLRSLPGLTAAEWLNGLRWAWETAASHPYADSCVRQTGSLAAFCAAWSRIVSYHATYKAPTRR